MEAAGQAHAGPKVDDLRAAGDRPPGGEAQVPEEVVVAEPIAVVPLAEERMQAPERRPNTLEYVRRKVKLPEAEVQP